MEDKLCNTYLYKELLRNVFISWGTVNECNVGISNADIATE